VQSVRSAQQGCQVQVNKKRQTTCEKNAKSFQRMPNKLKQANAVGFDITR